MATKEHMGGRLLRFPRGDSVSLSRRALLRTAETGVSFLLGAVLSGAELFGLYAPFGVAAVAAAGSGLTGFASMLGACLGYLCLEGLEDGMRYAAAAILTYSVAFAFYDARLYKKSWFMPGIACLISAATGFVCRAGQGWYGEDLVFFVTEVIFTGAAAYFYAIIFAQWPQTLEGLRSLNPRQGAGFLMLSSTVLMSLGRVEMLDTFSAGRLLAGVCIMAASRQGIAPGVLTGACSGVALDLAAGKSPCCSMIFTLAGLACGLCWEKRRLVAGGVYTLAVAIAVLWTWEGGLRAGMPVEAFAGAVCFLFLPLEWEGTAPRQAALPAATGELRVAQQAAARRMEQMAGAFHTLYDNIRETLRPEETNTENPAEIFTRTADRVCARCVLRGTCWQKEYEDTRRACNDATASILERGRALTTDFVGSFSTRCIHFPEFLGEVNRQLTAFLRRRQSLQRTRQTRAVLCSQYARMDELMRHAAAELSGEFTPDLPRQERLAAFLRSMNLTGGAVCYDAAGRLRAETPFCEELQHPAARRELSRVLGVALKDPAEEGELLVFRQAEPYRVTVAMAGCSRRGETVSGDTALWFRREDGVFFLLLCDGMGSGAGAREESGRTARLVESFLRAGMEPKEAMETVSAALALRGDGGSSTTIDLLSIDLFTGRCRVFKQGAAPTYVRRERKIRCAVASSLPAGVLPGDSSGPDSHGFRGEEGDWILMTTDGVLCGQEDDWLRRILAGCERAAPEELANRVLQASQEQFQREDDSTVIALRLESNREV